MIRGHLTFETSQTVQPGQKVTVTVQDTSRAGDSAVEIAQTIATVPDGFDATKDALPFEIDIDTPAPASTIKAHLAKHDGDDIQIGDMITMTSIPATTDEDIAVPLRVVG